MGCNSAGNQDEKPDPVFGKAVTGKKMKQKKNPWELREWGPKLSLPLVSNRTEVSYQAVSFKPHASFQHWHMLFILPFLDFHSAVPFNRVLFNNILFMNLMILFYFEKFNKERLL